MKTIITSGNTKTGVYIPCINMPTTTCRADAPCAKGCYAKKGNFAYANVKAGIEERLKLFLNDSEKFFNTIVSELNGLITYRYVRWHASGEIVNMKYLYGMIKVAEKCPQTHFLCFTKKFNLINTYLSLGHSLPKNLSIVFSAWDKDFIVDNPFNLPVSYVDFRHSEMNANIPNNAYKCSGKCETCQHCWHMLQNQSVVFHQH